MRKQDVIIVSGLPRSGTSMMMQILEAGGIPPLTDGIREADRDNLRGYYEFEPVKKTSEDPSWLAESTGKAVKMVYRLLYDLPQDRQYKVIFMQRKLEEVLASQKAMLARLGQSDDAPDDGEMARLFRGELARFDEWASGRKCFSLLYVDYGRVIDSTATQVARVNGFLGGGLDAGAMAAVVDPLLYRQRQ